MRTLAAVLLLLPLLAHPPAASAEDEQPAPKAAPPAKKAPPPVCAKDAVFEKVATGFRFTEGPSAGADQHVYFTDIPNERIHRFDTITGTTSVWRTDTGRANGLMHDARGNLLACEGGRRQLVRIGKDGKSTVLAARWNDKRFNSPNDLSLDAHGGVWFTDPRYGKRQDDREIDIEAVYYVNAKGAVTQVQASPLLVKPNGIRLARDGRTLYVAASRKKYIVAFPVTKPGTVGTPRIVMRLDPEARGGPDGLSLDERGNVYCAGQGHIWCWHPDGRRLLKKKVPESPTNCAFGGPKRRTLYVTARTSLYRLPMQVAGAPSTPAR